MQAYHATFAAAELLNHHRIRPSVLVDLNGEPAVLGEGLLRRLAQDVVVGGPRLISSA
jgi:hypothetical protein